jgi:predicted dehydrogenase
MRTQAASATDRFSRRSFFTMATLAAAGAALPLAGCRTTRRALSANEKLNVGIIGVSGQGGYSVNNLKDQNIVALCDVDANRLAAVSKDFPAAKTYSDFRRLIGQRDIDAIAVCTPDHTHAVAAAAALRSGRDVYCEKPLTHTVSESRILTELARKHKAVTQIGTQIHAGDNYRRVVELVRTGVIGRVKEVHVWQQSVYGGMERPADAPPAPAHLDWDLWLGPVEPRPYSSLYVPVKWRNWWAFGGGTLADFGCHYMDLPFWALNLQYPSSIEPLAGPPVHSESVPRWLIIRYEFPVTAFNPGGMVSQARYVMPLTWYHGGKYPEQLISPELYRRWRSGVLFVGEKGQLLADYGRNVLLPEEKFAGFQRPSPVIPNSIGHHKEWVEAIKTRGKTTCHFGYSGPLTEAALLGNVAYRAGCKLEWDAEHLRAKNCPQAEELVQHHYRKGWVL